MPRTKYPRKRMTVSRLSTSQVNDILEKLDLNVKEKEKELELEFQNKLNQLNMEYQFSLLKDCTVDIHKTIGQLREEDLKKNSKSNSSTFSSLIPVVSKPSSLCSTDDGYITDVIPVQGNSLRNKQIKSTRRMSRSLSRGDTQRGTNTPSVVMGPPTLTRKGRQRSSSQSSAMSRFRSSKSQYRTPRCHMGIQQYPPITPKVAPNTPLAVLRRPRQGEMVISLTGSPLLVNTSINGVNDKANCNIPLADGTVISLMPNKLRDSAVELPFHYMKPETKEELKTLQENINTYLKKIKNKK